MSTTRATGMAASGAAAPVAARGAAKAAWDAVESAATAGVSGCRAGSWRGRHERDGRLPTDRAAPSAAGRAQGCALIARDPGCRARIARSSVMAELRPSPIASDGARIARSSVTAEPRRGAIRWTGWDRIQQSEGRAPGAVPSDGLTPRAAA